MAKFRGFNTVDQVRPSYVLTGTDLVKRDLLNEFYTRQGERVMRPKFGSRIWDYLMDPSTVDLDQLIREDITKIIKKEPRAELVDIKLYVLDHTVSAEVLLRFVPGGTEDSLYLEYNREITEGID